MNVNPRANGFNYGVGWGAAAKPPIYYEAMRTCADLRDVAHRTSRVAWALEMAIRNVRLAETAEEKHSSVVVLQDEMRRHTRELIAAE
jgi:hypothetical protein